MGAVSDTGQEERVGGGEREAAGGAQGAGLELGRELADQEAPARRRRPRRVARFARVAGGLVAAHHRQHRRVVAAQLRPGPP